VGQEINDIPGDGT